MRRQRVALGRLAYLAVCGLASWGLAMGGCSEESKPPTSGVGPAGPGSTSTASAMGGMGGMGGAGTGGAGANGGAGGATELEASFDNVVGSNLMETSFNAPWKDITVQVLSGGTLVRGLLIGDPCSVELNVAIGGDLAQGNSYALSSTSDPEMDPTPPSGEAYLTYRKTCTSSDSEWRSTGGTLDISMFDGSSLDMTFDAPMGVSPYINANAATGSFDATGSGTNILMP